MSEIVARTGCPCSPQTSQNATGHPAQSGSGSWSFFRRSPSLSDIAPAFASPREVPLHVGHENRHADAREALGEQLQRDRLAGAGRAGDAAVPVGEGGEEGDVGLAVAGDDERVGHGLGSRG